MMSETLRASDQTLSWREGGVDDKMVLWLANGAIHRSSSPDGKSALAIAMLPRKRGIALVDSQYAARLASLHTHGDQGITTITRAS